MTGSTPRVWLDHIVVAIDDLEAGAEAFEALTGVRPQFGGEHPNLGTHNTLLSLGGDQYFEIIARRPGAELSPLFGEADGKATLTPIMWAVATDDISALRRHLNEAGYAVPEPVKGSRSTPAGEIIRWSMFMMGPDSPDRAPFVLEWDPETRHPSKTNPTGCTLDSLTITCRNSGRLGALLDTMGLDVPVAEGPTRMVVDLKTPLGLVTIGGGPELLL